MKDTIIRIEEFFIPTRNILYIDTEEQYVVLTDGTKLFITEKQNIYNAINQISLTEKYK